MIAIVLMGILAAIAIPSWFGIVESRNVAVAANQLAADLRFANSSATNRLGTASVYFQADNFTNTMNCDTNNDGDIDATVDEKFDYCLVRPTQVANNASTARDESREFTGKRLPDGIGIRMGNIAASSSLNEALYITSARRVIKFSNSGSVTTSGSLNASTVACPSGNTSGVPVLVIASERNNNAKQCISINAATSKVNVD